MVAISLLFIFLNSNASVIKCEWYQTKVSNHNVKGHIREGTVVAAHQRKEHCRERWPKADLFSKRFLDAGNTGYLGWVQAEKEVVLKILGGLPEAIGMENFYFSRSGTAKNRLNPAEIEILSRTITLYNLFFTSQSQSSILIHESGHYHFSKMSEPERETFLQLSGWKRVIKGQKLRLEPPQKLIIDDSGHSPDEDFSNYLETYYLNPQKIHNSNPGIFLDS